MIKQKKKKENRKKKNIKNTYEKINIYTKLFLLISELFQFEFFLNPSF